MTTINISNRLHEIASKFNLNDKVADVGSDHGYLLILLKNKGLTRLLGIENKKGPFKHLKESKENYFLEDVEISFSDGIDYLPNDIDTLSLCGMGGKNIISILEKHLDKLKQINKIVVSPHIDIAELRTFLISNDFYIHDESIIFDKKYYFIMVFKKGKKEYSQQEIFFGPMLLKNRPSLFEKYYVEKVNFLKQILKKDISNVRRSEINNAITFIEDTLWKKEN